MSSIEQTSDGAGDTLRICLWSGPRNVSTAIMYSFAQRADTSVVDEPFYAHYLRVSGAEHPAGREILASQDTDGARVARNLILAPGAKPILFFKQMAHHLVDIDLDFLDHTANVLLVRDPKDMLRSFAKTIANPTLENTGLKRQWELLEEMRRRGQDPPVLDARYLLSNPADVLEQLCARLRIEFDPKMLSWPAGPIEEDGIWAPHWYHNVHKSTGFGPYTETPGELPSELQAVYVECLPYYEHLITEALVPRSVPDLGVS